MTKPYMFLSCIVPDPFNPVVGIDVYLQPLINDLKNCGMMFRLMMFQESKIS